MNESQIELIRGLIVLHVEELYKEDVTTQTYLIKRSNELLNKLIDDFPFSPRKNISAIASALIYFAHTDLAVIKIPKKRKPITYDNLIGKQIEKIQRTAARLQKQRKKLEELKLKKKNAKNTPRHDYFSQEGASKLGGLTLQAFGTYVKVIDEKLDILKKVPGIAKKRETWKQLKKRNDIFDNLIDEHLDEFLDHFADKEPIPAPQIDEWLLNKGVNIRDFNTPPYFGVIHDFLYRPKLKAHVKYVHPGYKADWDKEAKWIIKRET